MIEKLKNHYHPVVVPTKEIIDKINEIIDHLPQEKENLCDTCVKYCKGKAIISCTSYFRHKQPTKEPLSFNCTLAKFAEQLDVPLWKAMEFGKYFKGNVEAPSVEEIEKEIRGVAYEENEVRHPTDLLLQSVVAKVAQAIHNFITKGCSQ